MAELNKKRPKNKGKKKNGFRNAGNGFPPARARTTATATMDDSRNSPAWRALKAIGGGGLAAAGCAAIAREKWLPPKFLTLGVAGIGATLAVAAHSSTARDMGLGAVSASLGQLLLLLIDDHQQAVAAQADAKKPAPSLSKQPQVGNLDGLPPGALEAAYERARAQLAATN